MSFILGIIYAFIGQSTINFGFILQKKGVKVLHQQLQEIPTTKRLFSNPIWVIGLVITASGGIFNFLALSEISVLIVQAFLAVGIALIPIFAWFLLNEKVTSKDLLGLTFSIVGVIILVVSLFSVTMLNITIDTFSTRIFQLESFVYHAVLFSFLVFMFGFFFKRKYRLGLFFGVLSGVCAGYAQVLTRPLAVNTLNDLFTTIKNPLSWLLGIMIIVLQVASIIIMQDGFKKGNATEVTLSYNVLALLVPVTASILLLKEWVFMDLIPIVIAIIGIFIMLSGIFILSESSSIQELYKEE